jgi:flagellar motor switch protein FliG
MTHDEFIAEYYKVSERAFFLSKKARREGLLSMEYMGPVRAEDVDGARRKIVYIMRHLEDIGEITIQRFSLEEKV